jgi:hypothetical protein
MSKRNIFLILLVLIIGGCATMPTGPTVMVLPPPGKSFDQFQYDDAVCRQWAAQQIGLSPQEVANQNTATGAVVGTAVGAGLGAAIGSASGHTGSGAAIGAASGLFFGMTSGANAGQAYGWRAQRQYDIAYQQCMYAKGNQIPGMRTRPARISAPRTPPDLSSGPRGSSAPYPVPAPPPEK